MAKRVAGGGLLFVRAWSLAGLCIVLFSAEISAQDKSSDTWKEVDVVPMPREIALTGDSPVLEPSRFVLVTGDTPSRQSQLGAEWINKRIVRMGGRPLSILKTGDAIPPDAVPIVIGSKEDNTRIAGAVADGLVNVGAKNPGVRGYELRFVPDRGVFLAGADSLGVLYACVTFAELLQETGGQPAVKAANVRDWPDIQYLYVLDMEPPSNITKNQDSPDARKTYLEKLSRMYEGMLRRKLSVVWYKPLVWGDTAFRDMTPYARETVRMGIEAGKELGIESLYYHLSPFVGLRSDHPDVDPALLEQRPKARYDKWLQSWSMDEERKAYARELAAWIKEVGFTDVGFHDTDTGGYLNPANWNNRGTADQKRWGDDYASATINKFKIFYDELIRANPELRVNLTLYPYTSEIFDPSEQARADLMRTLNLNAEQLAWYRNRYESYWARLNEAFPKKDVAFAIREPWSADGGPGLKAFLKLIDGRPLFAWYGLAAAEFYSNVPSWLGTLHSGSVDDIVFTQNIYVDRGYVPILSLAMREYSWNTKAPGAATFQSRDRAKMFESAAGDSTTEAYTVVLPHLVRNYFGRSLAPEITKALAANVSPFIVFGGRPDRNIIDETESRMKAESLRATEAAASMDAAWSKLGGSKNTLGLEADVFARVAYLRQVFHSTQLVASVKESIYRSQRLSAMNHYDEAAQAIAEATDLLKQGSKQLASMEAEGPLAIGSVAGSARLFLDKTAPVLQELLGQREQAIASSRRSGGVPAKVLDILAAEKDLPIVTVDTPPTLDGSLGDPAWRKSHVFEAWFLVGPERLMADAETQFRALADKKNLYVGFRCQTTPGTDVGLEETDREFIRIYIDRPGDKNNAMFAVAVWANGKVESTDRKVAIRSKVKVEKGRWEGELEIPLTAFGSAEDMARCRMGFLRSYSRMGVANVSATVPLDASIGGSFEAARSQLGSLPLIKWGEADFNASARVRILEPKVREVTLDDRIATIVDFRITADSDCVLEDVTVEAEAMDADGKVESKKQLLAEPSMKYSLKPSEPFSVTFLQAVEKGGVRVKLNANRVSAEAIHQFGQ